jgi:hypothetical protein
MIEVGESNSGIRLHIYVFPHRGSNSGPYPPLPVVVSSRESSWRVEGKFHPCWVGRNSRKTRGGRFSCLAGTCPRTRQATAY